MISILVLDQFFSFFEKLLQRTPEMILTKSYSVQCPDQDQLLLEEWYSLAFPNSRVHVGVLHWVRGFSFVDRSHNRIDFVHIRHDCRGYVKIMWPFLSFSFRIPLILEAAGFSALFLYATGSPVTSFS